MFKFHYALVSVLTSITTLFLAAFVYSKGKGKKLNLLYAFWALCVGLWSFFLVLNIYAPTQGQALLWCRMLHVWAIILPAVYVHFVLLFLYKLKSRSALVYFLYFLTGMFAILDFTPWFIATSFREKFGFFVTEPRALYPFHVATFVGSILYVYAELFHSLCAATGPKRKQIEYFLIASLIGYSGGVTNYLINYDYLIFPLYPFGNYTILAYVAVIGIAIVKYRLMNIEVIIKKTLVFAGLFGFVAGTVSVVVYLFNTYLARFIGISQTTSTGIAIVLAILLYDPVKNGLIRLTDRYLLQKKEDFRKILNRLSQNIITILDIDKVGETILSTLRESLRLESGAIILKEEDGENYSVRDSFNVPSRDRKYKKDDFFIRYLFEYDGLLNLEDEAQRNLLPVPVLGKLAELNAVICTPLFLHKELIGVLTLGRKRSDEEFTSEELGYLPTVANQVAIALSNARLYDILMKSRLDFAQQAKMAAIGTLSAGISHEIKNPLGAIKGLVEMIRFNKKLGVYGKMTKEEYEAVVEDAIGRILNNISRAVGVIDRLSGFARKPKELKIEPVSLERAVEGALDFLKSEFENFGVEVGKDFIPNLPLVSADLHAMEEVFLNILVNARHAIREKGTITIKTVNHGGEAEVSIQDTGQGISPEHLERIFDPFFTTKDTARGADPSTIKGSGLGLFIVRETIRQLGGRITAESTLGKGTTFHIFLPVTVREPAGVKA